VAFEGLAVTTIMPVTVRALHGLSLYAWGFSGFMLGTLVGTVAAGDYAAEQSAAFSFTGAFMMLGAGLIICGGANSMLLLIAGRVVEGLGTGAVRSLAWFAINRACLARDHVRMSWCTANSAMDVLGRKATVQIRDYAEARSRTFAAVPDTPASAPPTFAYPRPSCAANFLPTPNCAIADGLSLRLFFPWNVREVTSTPPSA
jgi:hypothetical protein